MRANKILVGLALAATLFASAGCNKTHNAASTNTPVSTTAATDASSTSDCPTANTTSFAKTKFLAHTGLAFGAFRHWIYKPYQAQSFTTGSIGHKIYVFGKAGVAALFVEHEVRLAAGDVKANPTLCKVLYKPLADLSGVVKAGVTKLKHGDSSGITSLQTSVSGIEDSAKSNGLAITENEAANITSSGN